jgi:hypothetical protein
MQSKNKRGMRVAEKDYVSRVAQCPCAVCRSAGPVEVHEIKQGQWFTSVALCPGCHRHPADGLHGQKVMWRVKKMDELDALAQTLQDIWERL